jgi:dihydrofolate reductase
MKASIIVATSINGVIGIDNKLPWNCSGDLKHFQQTTTDSTIIMGRNTYESIGKALPHRKNIVLTNNTKKYLSEKYEGKHKDVFFVSDISSTVKAFNALGKVFIIGGSTVYNLALSLDIVDEIILTTIKQHYEGDTFFKLSSEWKPVKTIHSNEEYDIRIYRRD